MATSSDPYLSCAGDEAAVDETKQLIDGHDLELWQRDRAVAKSAARAGPDK
jgi:hypothetical protein